MKSIAISKQFLLVTLALCLCASLFAQNLRTPRISPPIESKTTIGLTDITINYSSPIVKRDGNDRTGNIWGGPVWYGYRKFGASKLPWRAGANENTIITFSDDVKVEGKDLKAGKYGLQMAVFEDAKVTVIFSKNTGLWGSMGYDPKEDALRVETRLEDSPFSNLLTYSFLEVGKDYGILALSWENKRIPIKISVDTKETVLANFRGQLAHGMDKHWQALNDAAAYCAQNNFNHKEAMAWVEHSIQLEENDQNLATKGQLFFQIGKKKEAKKIVDGLAERADVYELNNIGYQMMSIKEYDKAIEYFALNVERNPKVPNCHDSLGEAYMEKGEKKKAIESFKKALSLNPPDYVKQNAMAKLKDLGVEPSGH